MADFIESVSFEVLFWWDFEHVLPIVHANCKKTLLFCCYLCSYFSGLVTILMIFQMLACWVCGREKWIGNPLFNFWSLLTFFSKFPKPYTNSIDMSFDKYVTEKKSLIIKQGIKYILPVSIQNEEGKLVIWPWWRLYIG